MTTYKIKLLNESIKQSMLLQLEQRDILFAFDNDNVVFSCSIIDRVRVSLSAGLCITGGVINAEYAEVTKSDHMLLSDKSNLI